MGMLVPASKAAEQVGGDEQPRPEGSDIDSGDDEDVDMDDLEALDGDDTDGIVRGFDADGGAAARDRARVPREPREERADTCDRAPLTEAQLAHRVNMLCELFEAVFQEARGKKPHTGALSSLAAFAIYDKAKSIAAVDRLQVTASCLCAACMLAAAAAHRQSLAGRYSVRALRHRRVPSPAALARRLRRRARQAWVHNRRPPQGGGTREWLDVLGGQRHELCKHVRAASARQNLQGQEGTHPRWHRHEHDGDRDRWCEGEGWRIRWAPRTLDFVYN